jgi:uncharacterized membrane protein
VLSFQQLDLIIQFPQAAIITAGLGLVNVVAVLSSYKSFEIGKLSIVSPLQSGFPALSTILAIVFLNETVSPLRAVGITMTLGGIVFVTMQAKSDPASKGSQDGKRRCLGEGTAYAIVTFLGYGVVYFALKIVIATLGSLITVLIPRIVGVLVLGGIFLITKPAHKGNVRNSRVASLLVVVAAFDIFAGVSYNFGVAAGLVSVVSTIAGLYSVVTVFLARLFLKDRLNLRQGIGVIVILIGVGLLGFAG